MENHKIVAGGGIQLHLVETGNLLRRATQRGVQSCSSMAFFATGVEESVRSLESFLRMCFAQELLAEDLYLMLGYNLSVPPYVRHALFSRSFDNDDLLPRIRKPVLITHGAGDAVVKPTAVDQHKAGGLAHAQIQIVPNAGHAPFGMTRQCSISASGSFPQAYRSMAHSAEHAVSVHSPIDGQSAPYSRQPLGNSNIRGSCGVSRYLAPVFKVAAKRKAS